jgi:hypothetical protein
MKLFGTLVIAHKIAGVEDLIKIGQYTLNSYNEQHLIVMVVLLLLLYHLKIHFLILKIVNLFY